VTKTRKIAPTETKAKPTLKNLSPLLTCQVCCTGIQSRWCA